MTIIADSALRTR